MTSPEKTLLETGLVEVGMFRCPPDHEAFPGGTVNDNLVVFPRTSVRIEREAAPPVVADPTVAVLYAPPVTYRRFAVDPRGDHCDYFAIDEATTNELSADIGVDVAEVFRQGSGRVGPPVYFAQRRLFDLAAAGRTTDPMAIEEGVLVMVRELLANARPEPGRSSGPRRAATEERHRRLVSETAEFLACHFTAPLSLGGVARQVGSSPHHLARIFRRISGMSIHQRLLELRLKRALEILGDGDFDISLLAIELGFSSHSHFTRAFKRSFGVNPSVYRDELRQLRAIVQAASS